MQYSTINRNGYHVEHNSLAAAARLAELQQMFAQVQSENTELNRRLSLQNRPGKQLGGVIECASIILSEHTAGGMVGAMAIKGKYPNVGRRRRSACALTRVIGRPTFYASNWQLGNNCSSRDPHAQKISDLVLVVWFRCAALL